MQMCKLENEVISQAFTLPSYIVKMEYLQKPFSAYTGVVTLPSYIVKMEYLQKPSSAYTGVLGYMFTLYHLMPLLINFYV